MLWGIQRKADLSTTLTGSGWKSAPRPERGKSTRTWSLDSGPRRYGVGNHLAGRAELQDMIVAVGKAGPSSYEPDGNNRSAGSRQDC